MVLAQNREEKLQEIAAIYQSYLEKDITFLLKVKKTEKLSQLFKILAGQIGQIVNYSELSNSLGLSIETIKNYLWYLEKTFVVKKLTPFYRNIRKEITKAPVYYFGDLGLRNFILGLFGNQMLPQDAGFLFQNFVFLKLQKISASFYDLFLADKRQGGG